MGILRVAVSLPLCCGAGVQPSIHVQYDNVLISMQPLHHGELLRWWLVLVSRERESALPHMQACSTRARSPAMAWAGMPAAVRPKVAFLLVFYSLLESSRCRKTLQYLFGFL